MKKQFLFFVATLLGMSFAFTGCGQQEEPQYEVGFNPRGKTYVYDSWAANQALSEDDTYMVEGMTRGSYGNTQFIFNTDGTYKWENKNTHEISLQGTWTLGEITIQLKDSEGNTQENLIIDGLKFYVTQHATEELNLYIFYKEA